MIRYRSRPAVIILPTRRKVAAILALQPPPPVAFIPHKRKPRRIIRLAVPRNHKRNHFAGIIGAISTLTLAQAGWAWRPNAIARSGVTQPPVKAWVWSPNAIIETAIATPAAKSWAWVGNNLISQRVITMARKAWNWTANPPAISGITIVYHVVKRSIGLKAKTRFHQ